MTWTKSRWDSNRTGHLFAAALAGAGLAVANTFVYQDPILYVTAAAVPLWEWFGTPDMDHNSRRAKGGFFRIAWVLWWGRYAKVVGHRSPLSHSLTHGLPLRLWHGFWPLWMAVFVLIGTGYDLRDFWPYLEAAIAGCVIADVIHMLKDGFNPAEIIRGKA